MSKNYTEIIENGLAQLETLSVAELIILCEVLDTIRHPKLNEVAERLTAAQLAEPQLRGRYFMAKALVNSGSFEQSWAMFAETLNAARAEVGALPIYIDCLLSLASTALKMGDANQSMGLATEAFNLAQDVGNAKGIANACNHFGSMKLQQGDIDGALEYLQEALTQAKQLQSPAINYPIYSNLGIAYMLQGNFAEALQHFNYTLLESQEKGHQLAEALTCINISNLYNGQGNYLDAMDYALRAFNIYEALREEHNLSYAYGLLGDIHKDLKNYDSAINNYYMALQLRKGSNDVFGQASAYHLLGSVLALNGIYDSAAENLLHAREICENQGYGSLLATVYLELGGLYILQERFQDAYEALQIGSELAANAGHKHLRNKLLQYRGELELNRGNPREALPVLLEGEALAAELSLEDDLRKIHLLLSRCHEQLGNLAEALAYHKRFYERDQKIHGEENARLIASLQFGHQLEQKNKEAEIERLKHVELKKAYNELKSAQDRLVKQEKLVSLGRLVTGIAHELQNPLNFVTNFTSLTIDLMEELKEAADDEDKADITSDITENLEKISTHGKRASAIVKGMLELKRDGSGAPQPVALSRIIDEFVTLAWNNYRSKCPDLQVQINVVATDKDVFARVISTDVGRAIISLLNNALDAVKESADKMGSLYTPTINVSLSKKGTNAVIVISDNGPGVAAGTESLVFEPFFTTKITGSGNIGLGLSLAHDMIMAQGGQIELENKPEFGATFTILLPLVEAD